MTVKIITDSVTDLPPELIKDLDITLIPIILRWGEKEYRDGIDLQAEEFYRMLPANPVHPATSLPPPSLFVDAYNRLSQQTDDILVITLSRKLSGLSEVALSSIDLMDRKCRVEVLDSGTATLAEGFIVLSAARAAKTGASMEEVMEIARKNIPRASFLSTFDTLEYLRRGGRIGKARAFLGNILKVNPLITLKDGVVEPAGQTYSRRKAIERLVNFVRSYSKIEELGIQSATTPDEASLIAGKVSDIFPAQRIIFSRPSPVMGVHTGPGFILVAVLGEKA